MFSLLAQNPAKIDVKHALIFCKCCIYLCVCKTVKYLESERLQKLRPIIFV